MPITIGSVEVDIIPNTQGIYETLKEKLVPAATDAGKDAGDAAGRAFGPAMASKVGDIGLAIGQQIGEQIANRIKDAVSDALKTGVTIGGQKAKAAGVKQGDETGGAFARAMKARLEAAFRALPKADVRLSDTGVEADLARLRARMETLAGKRIGIDVDVAAADAEIADIEARLQRLGAAHPNVAVRADTAAARAQLEEMRAEIARLTADPTRIRVETDGSFGQRLRAQVEAAQAALPNINIGADTSPAQAELASLRAQLATLSGQRVGIDIDAATATARIDGIRERLARLAVSSPDVAVRVDAATAEAQLAQVAAMADALDGKDIDLHVNTSEAMSAVFQLAVAIGALAAIPAIPILAAGAGSLVASFTAAGVGVGAFAAAALPAISNIKGALTAQKQAQDAAATSTAKGAQVAAQAASRSLQMAGAQQALASAERNAAQQIAAAQRQVVQAKQGVRDAVQQAALAQQQADRNVATAEKNLAADQKAAKQAQLDLTAARKAAADQLVDLNNSLVDSQLSQRRAALTLSEAQAKLNADKAAGAKVTADQLAQDQLAYDEAVQNLAEQQIQTKRLQDQTTAANKAGVTGSSTYKQAQDALAQAQQKVADQTQTLKDAQAAQTRTEVANARSIADAQAKVADAERNVAQAQASAADSIASAQRQVQSASLSAAGSVDASATAATKYQQALAKLSPSARGTFDAFVGLRSAVKAWSLELQPKTMPLFTRALDGLKNSLPGVTPLVNGAASAIGTLQDKVSKGFKSPWWKSLKADFQKDVGPAIVGLGTAIGNIFIGSAGVVDAFLSHLDGIDSRMSRITGRFANWGRNLKGSPAFENFLSYSAQEAPKLANALGKIGTALVDTAKAVSPLSGPVLVLLGALATGISAVATNTPGLVQILYGLFVVTKLVTLSQIALTGAMAVYKAGVILSTLLTEGWTAAILAADAAFELNPVVAIITVIVAAIALLVAGTIYAWNHFASFRAVVLDTWHAIQVAALYAWNAVLKPTFNAIAVAALWLWNNALKPTFAFIVAAFRAVAAVAMWLWHNAISPVFSAIGAVISWWWTNIVQRYFGLVTFVFRTFSALLFFVYNMAVKPVFTAFGIIISWWWTNIVQRYFGLVRLALSILGSAFHAVYDAAVKPVFNAIGSLISSVWRNGISPTFSALKSAVNSIGTAFSDTKDAIGIAWDKIRDLTKKPVNFVINDVWNKGIVSVWQKIGGWIPGLPKLDKLPLLAQGGTLPVQPGVFNKPTAIVGEGNPAHPEYVIPTDPKYRTRALRLLQQAGTQMLSSGGIIGDIGNIAGDVGSAVWNGVTTAASFIADPVKGLEHLLSPITNKLKPLTKSPWGKMVASIPKMAIKGLEGLVSIGGGGTPAPKSPFPKVGTGVRQWFGVIQQALQLLGQSPAWVPTVARRMNQESGGNPTAVNLWDSNAKAGHPSVGLMQVIAGTFREYADTFLNRGPFSYGVSVDPLANTYAGLNYAIHRYGSLSALNRPGGYDSGGWLMPGQLGFNGLSKPEAVLTPEQFSSLAGAAQRGDAASITYQINARTADFTVADLQLVQRQQEARLRVGRPH